MFVVLHYNRQESRPKRPLRKLLQYVAQYCCQCANTKEKKKKTNNQPVSVFGTVVG